MPTPSQKLAIDKLREIADFLEDEAAGRPAPKRLQEKAAEIRRFLSPIDPFCKVAGPRKTDLDVPPHQLKRHIQTDD